jgi:hypothetical protein
MAGGFKKFKRPDEPRRGAISDRDLDLLETILNYRFCAASELARLVGGNEDVTFRRLRLLWEMRLISRFAFAGIHTHSQFYYYLDNPEALHLLFDRGRLKVVDPQMLEEVKGNQQRDYATAAHRHSEGQLLFLRHELMLSRLHFMLEQGAKSSSCQLEAWRQGAVLQGSKVEVPVIKSTRSGNTYLWQEHDVQTERLPVEPDALFTLRFPDRPAEQQLVHFCYEADRGTMNMTDMMKKLRSYYHFIKKQQKHKQAFGVHPIRAVLIETTDEDRALKLMELVHHPLVVGPDRRSALFWFTITPQFTDPQEASPLPRYLDEPEIVFEQIWVLPTRAKLRLGDMENSPSPSTLPLP